MYSEGLYEWDENDQVKLKDDWTGVVGLGSKRYNYPEDYPFEKYYDKRFRLRSPWFDNECDRSQNRQEVASELEIDYLESGYQYFEQYRLTELEDEVAVKPVNVGSLSVDIDTSTVNGFTAHEKGETKLWINLDHRGNPPTSMYSVGVDISTGTGSSNSVIAVADRVTGEKVAEWVHNNTTPFNW